MTQETQTEPKIIDLLIIQTGHSKVDSKMRHVIQEMAIEESSYFYDFGFDLGGNKVSNGSFGVPMIIRPDLQSPIVGIVGKKEDREQLLHTVEAYFNNEVLPGTSSAIDTLTALKTAIESGEYDINEIGA